MIMSSLCGPRGLLQAIQSQKYCEDCSVNVPPAPFPHHPMPGHLIRSRETTCAGEGYWGAIQGGLEEDPVPWGSLPSQALAWSCPKSPFSGDSMGLTSPEGHGELEPGVPALKSPF